ncbi:MAG: PQQ-binding-like beta-propeller repeat protein [Pyrinomonadaceae bacterium]
MRFFIKPVGSEKFPFKIPFSKCLILLLGLTIWQLVPRPATGQTTKQFRLEEVFQEGTPVFRGIASDNENRLYFSNQKGSVKCLDYETKTILWKTEVGGEIISPFFPFEDRLFFLSKGSSETAEKDGNLLNSISRKTGVTLWRKKLLGERNVIFPVLKNLFATDPGSISGISTDDGQTIGKIEYEGGDLLVFEVKESGAVLAGNKRKELLIFPGDDGQLVRRPLKQNPTAFIQAGDGTYIWGDQSGNIGAFEKPEKPGVWRAKAGGEISSLTEVGENVLITSLDNFAYLYSIKSGSLRWKKRLGERIVDPPLLVGKLAVFAFTNSELALFLEVEKGKMVDRILLPEGLFFTGPPARIEGALFFPTSSGLRVYREVSGE